MAKAYLCAMQQGRPFVRRALQVLVSLCLGGSILWWMYRGFSAEEFGVALSHSIDWTWMIASLPFGIMACWLRAMRWRQLMQPLGLEPRRHVTSAAIFIGYAASLVLPRVGEVLRCGVLKRFEGASFSQGVGTVVTERAIDSLLLILLATATMLSQLDIFTTFFTETGMGLQPLLLRFTPTGWGVTAVCLLAIAALGIYMLRRLKLFSKMRDKVGGLRSGIMSIRGVDNKPLFWCYSVGIWAAYYLHFYVAFFCFEPTACLSPTAALVAFVVGSFAVLVPTPNGAGAWHFATKTVLVLYGVSQAPAAVFVLVVHTVQTLLVALLGLYALVALQFTTPINTNIIRQQNS